MQKPALSFRFRPPALSLFLGRLGAALLVLLAPPAISEPPNPVELRGAMGVFARGSKSLTPGTEAALRVATHLSPSETETQPLGGVAVTISLSGSGKSAKLSDGVTEPSGYLDAHFAVPSWPAGKYQLEIRARIADQVSVQSQAVELIPSSRILVQSDKPLYQPGQTVHIRSLTLRSQDGRPQQGGKVRFSVEDPRRNRILQVEQPVSAFGIASADLPLAEELLLGSYQIQAEQLSSATVTARAVSTTKIEVSRYVLPKLKVSVAAEQSYYEPGAEAKFSVSAQYFQGKPVVGGKVTVRAHAQSSGQNTALATLHGRLDSEGKLALRLPLPKDAQPEEQKLVLDASVEDEAAQRAETRSEIQVVRTPVQLDIVPEAGQLISDVPNRVHVLVARPDGSPIPNAQVSLQLGSVNPVLLRANTSAIGIATVEHRPAAAVIGKGAAKEPDCAAGELLGRATVTLPGRSPVSEQRCLGVRSTGGLLLRTDRAVYPRGDGIVLSVLAPAMKDGLCFVDVVRDQQTQETLVIPLHAGQGKVTVKPTDRMSGTVALLAYLLGPDGQQIRDGRLVYVERPSALRVEAKTELASGDRRTELRPGDEARLRLRVVDADSGVGVPAAIGLVMVDEALLALRPLRPGLLRAYFSLGESARKAAALRKFSPGGLGIDALVERGGLSALEQEAAQLLLSGAAAPWESAWETNPWAERRQALVTLKGKWSEAVHRYEKGHSLGERIPGQAGKWRYRADLPSLMRTSGVLSLSELRDPWRRPLTTEMLIQAASLPPFEEYVKGLLDDKLTDLYSALWKQIDAELKSGTRQKDKDGSVVISEDDLKRLGDALLVDPWGTRMRLQTRKRVHKIGPLLSKTVIYTAGPDGVFGTADDLYPSDNICYHQSCRRGSGVMEVVGIPAAQAFAQHGMLCGCGYGAAGGGLAGRHASIVRMVAASAESSGVAGKKDSVRSSFPETLLYRPEVLTDEKGEATVPLTIADSITTWRLLAEAVAQDGRLGSLVMGVPVSQDFFVDLDLPPVITQHDELAVPVPVYNHLKLPQRVTLTLLPDPWFEPLGPLTDTIELAPGQAGVRYFRIKASAVGKQALRLSARGSVASDAVERHVEVVPDGIEQVSSVQERLTGQRASHSVSVPAMVIPGTSEVLLKLYPAPAAHVVEGLDSLLRMPHGCFEQTSSTTYPNALILQYLRRTRRSTPAIETKALEYLGKGYQKLLSFEVPGGGFSWFGSAPAHKVLTAYGLEEFADMSEVYSVDPKVIARTQRWLLSQQRSDGSFEPDHGGIREGAINAMADDTLRTTAYVALAVKRTDSGGAHHAAIERAKDYVRKTLTGQVISDPYTLSLCTELLGGGFVPLAGKGEGALPLAEKLWATRQVGADGRAAFFTPSSSTPTHGNGKSGIIETTAMAASALHRSAALSRSSAALSFLVSAKDSFGTWHSTQATIRALKAMLLAEGGNQQQVDGTIEVLWNGVKHTSLRLTAKEESMRLVTLPAPLPGTHQLGLQLVGRGGIDYQLVTRSYVPRDAPVRAGASVEPSKESTPITIRTELSTRELRREQSLIQTVHLSAKRESMMPLLSAGIPPGFSVEREGLDLLVAQGQIEKYELTPRYVTLYLRKLEAGMEKHFPITLIAHLPGKVQVPASSVYPYYEPELRSQADPVVVTIQKETEPESR